MPPVGPMIRDEHVRLVAKVIYMSEHTLVIVRHAKAQQGVAGPDADRELTDPGLVQAEELGKQLSAVLANVDTVFVSQAARAKQTWEAMAKGAGVSKDVRVRTEPVIYSGDPMAIWEAVRLGSTGMTSVLIGHEPTISEVVALLLKQDAKNPVASGMPTGSAVTVTWSRNWKEWHSHCATLGDYVHVSHKA